MLRFLYNKPKPSKANFTFKLKHTFEKRLVESTRIKAKWPDRIPIIIENDQSSDLPTINKKQYIIPGNLTVGQLLYKIRLDIKLMPEKALFLFFGNNDIPPTSARLDDMYRKYQDNDGYLYIMYTSENTFG